MGHYFHIPAMQLSKIESPFLSAMIFILLVTSPRATGVTLNYDLVLLTNNILLSDIE